MGFLFNRSFDAAHALDAYQRITLEENELIEGNMKLKLWIIYIYNLMGSLIPNFNIQIKI